MNPTVEREVRFAVVMYGGVSLAIYMNGIAQEMLRLVRASAPPDAPDIAYSRSSRVNGRARTARPRRGR